MTRALPLPARREIARATLEQALPLARKAGYGRVRVEISERGAIVVTAEKGEPDAGPLVLDV